MTLTKREWIEDCQWVKKLKVPAGSRESATITKTMEAANEYFTARATWVRRSNVWSCAKADKELRWMFGMNRDEAKIELLRRGCRWTWIHL